MLKNIVTRGDRNKGITEMFLKMKFAELVLFENPYVVLSQIYSKKKKERRRQLKKGESVRKFIHVICKCVKVYTCDM